MVTCMSYDHIHNMQAWSRWYEDAGNKRVSTLGHSLRCPGIPGGVHGVWACGACVIIEYEMTTPTDTPTPSLSPYLPG